MRYPGIFRSAYWFGVCSTTMGLCVAAAVAAEPTLAEIQEAVEQASGDVQTARISYVSTNTDNSTYTNPPVPDNVAPGLPHRIPLVNENVAEELNRVRKLNRETHTRSTLVVDRASGSWKRDTKDLRDIDQLMNIHEIPDEQRINLVRTMSELHADGIMAILRPDPDWMSISFSPFHGRKDETILPLVNDWRLSHRLFDPTVHQVQSVLIEEATWEERPVVKLVFTRASSVLTYYLDPELGYAHYVACLMHTVDGRLFQEKRAEKYKKVDGVAVPFRFTTRQFDAEGTLFRESVWDIESAEINFEMTEEDLSLYVPSGTVLNDLRGIGGRAIQTFTTDMRVGRTMLPKLSEILAKSASADAPPSNADDQPRPARVLNFPQDRKVGSVGMYKLEPGQKFRFSLDGWNMWKGPSTHVDARGEVPIPENRMVVLHVFGKELRNLSWIARLGSDDVDAVRFEMSDPRLNLPVAGNEAMAHIARLTGLRELDIVFTDITDKGLEHLAELPNLEKLTLPGDITDVGFAEVARLPRLKVLSGLGHGVTSESMPLLAEITTLEELSLRRHQMADEDLAHLAKLPHLRVLTLKGYDLTDASLVHLQNIPSLKSLDVSGMNITDAGAAHLGKLTQIEELDLFNTLLTDRGMAHLAALPSLKKLTLEGMGGNRIQITDEGMVSIGRIASLEYLHLPSRSITDTGIAQLAALKRLNYLWAGGSSNSPLSDLAIEHIAHLSSLKTLKIGGKGITDDGLSHLAKLTNLQELWLFFVGPITDAGLAHLTNLRQLRKLWMPGSDGTLTVSGLNQLNALSDLTHIEVSGMSDQRDGSVLELNNLTELEELILPGVHLSDDDLVTLADLHRLQRLSIKGRFSRKGLSYLTGLPRLSCLGISGSGFTDEELSCLAECNKLWRLTVQGSFTDRGLLALTRCDSLRLLFIESDGPFSQRAIARLQNRDPPIHVVTNSVQASTSRSTGRRGATGRAR